MDKEIIMTDKLDEKNWLKLQTIDRKIHTVRSVFSSKRSSPKINFIKRINKPTKFRFLEIMNENTSLMKRIKQIITNGSRPIYRSNSSHNNMEYKKSLNENIRKKEQLRIKIENKVIYQ